MKIVLIKNKNSIIKGISLFIFISIIFSFIGISLIIAKADKATQPSFEVKIDSATPNSAFIGEDIKINGTITPKDFQAGVKSQKKEIVLVLDVSGSMNESVAIKCTNKRVSHKVEGHFEGRGLWKHWVDTYYIDDYCEEHKRVGDHEVESTKIAQLKKAANNFLNKINEVSNLKIGIVAYSSEATINPTLSHYNYNKYYDDYNEEWHNYDIKKSYSVNEQNTYSYVPDYKSLQSTFLDANSTNIITLKEMVDDLEALDATNTGEGLRKAEYMLEQGDPEASKSIIFMSDGQPTYCSVCGRNHDYYTLIDNTNPSYYGTGNSDEQGDCKEYAEKIGAIIKENKSNVFSIGYGLDSYGNDTMKDIHNSMGGLKKKFLCYRYRCNR